MRRNVESVNARFGNLVAIVAGDFLLARSAEIAASLGTEIAGLLANTLGLLCQGQVTEVRSAYSTERTEDDYLLGPSRARPPRSCRRRVASARSPAVCPAREVDVLTNFGRCFGMLFQLRDDILDVVATDEELGKPAGQDLAEGIYTLPVLLALRDPVTGPELRPLLGAPLDQPERDKARSIVAESRAIADTVRRASGSSTRPSTQPRSVSDARSRTIARGPGPVAARGTPGLAASRLGPRSADRASRVAASGRRSPRGCWPRRRAA